MRSHNPNFHIHVSVSDLYIPTIDLPIMSAYSAAGNMWTDPGNIYNYPSQTHECGNWDRGRAIPRKGIHKWNFRYSADGRKTKREAKGGAIILWVEENSNDS